ncbi:hypothetical protein PBY51_008404 [Eleginops maclovinus]|uniref:C-type lectin domain-containing protein n=1 Tax=Eleginops maclovinus TaxID=56733 RepID=A0AAN7XAY9_ELEMC|nr:hypothetical protein PBY51_008404 [Eleginops maclovinus]
MKGKTSVLLLLCAAVCGSSLMSTFVYHDKKKTWREAQSICREKHTDLATIRTTEQLEDTSHEDSWIGLYQENSGSEWKWSGTGETANFTNWANTEPNKDDELCVAVRKDTQKWADFPCHTKLDFFCDNEVLVLVKSHQTWDQALRHCRLLEAHDPNIPVNLRWNYRYDLATVHTAEDHAFARLRAQEATTDEVWTGLRFLAGQWFWMGNEAADVEMKCGWTQSSCGVLAKNSTQCYETADCNKKLNFLCRRKP